MDELRVFARQMASSSTKEYLPASPQKEQKSENGWWESFIAFWRVPAFPLAFRLAGVGMAIVLFLGLGSLLWQTFQFKRTAGEQPEIAEKQSLTLEATKSVSPLPNIQSSETPTMLVRLNDGKEQVTLDKDGNVTGVLSSYLPLVKQALTTQHIDTPQRVNALTGKSEVLMGAPEEGVPFALLSPVGTVVQSSNPLFRWRALKNAESYVLKIYDANYNEVSVSPSLTRTSWQLPVALVRGQIYSWQVTARVGDKEILSPVKPAPEARFLVLEQDKANELAQAQKAAAGSPLTLGILYAQAGLLNEAEREFQLLLRANPDSPLVQKLLQSVKAKKRK